MIRIYIVAAVRLYREGIEQVLCRDESLDVVGTAATSEDAFLEMSKAAPNVVLIDTGVEGGLALARSIRVDTAGPKVVAMAMEEETAQVIAWIEAGIIAYVSPEGSIKDLVGTIQSAVRGESSCSPRITASVFERLASLSEQDPQATSKPSLTLREVEVARLVAEGLSNKEIARTLSIALPTVKNHVHNIFEKLQVHRRIDAAAFLRPMQRPTSRVWAPLR